MIGKLNIKTAWREHKTILDTCFFTPPFKVANITEDKKSSALHLMIMNSSPGILDNDDYRISIDVSAHCHLHVQTQSYQRLFKMKTGAIQETNVNLRNHAHFSFIPHPTVPHEQSSFKTKNNIYLEENSSLILGEVLTCGRMTNDEIFKLSKYHTITNVYQNEKLIIRENLMMQPAQINPALMGQLENYTHQASLIYVNQNMEHKKIKESVYDMFNQEKDIRFGISAAPQNAVIVRILGFKAEQLFRLLNSISTFIQSVSPKENAIN